MSDRALDRQLVLDGFAPQSPAPDDIPGDASRGRSAPSRVRPGLRAVPRPEPAGAGATPGPPEPHVRRRRARELWTALHLPWLPLEALGVPMREGGPVAVVELQGRVQGIVAANLPALQAGVHPGMSLTAAAALVPMLATRPRDPVREREWLERLAGELHRFTPRVSLAPPDAVLLEVRGSARLFGGLRALHDAIGTHCVRLGAHPRLALAPTPLAALAGSRIAERFLVTDPARLGGALAALPLAALRWPARQLERLELIGVRTVGQALRLPRAGFARRFGRAALESLDRLTGRRADPQPDYRSPERFRARCEPGFELEHQGAVLQALAPLLQELGRFLESRQAGVLVLACRLQHRQAPATRCVLRLAAPEADPARLAALLAERLAPIVLPEPVRACELRSGALVPRRLPSAGLWQPGEHGGSTGTESSALVERLRARLGREAVHGLRLQPDHCPAAVTEFDLCDSPDPAARRCRPNPAAAPPSPDRSRDLPNPPNLTLPWPPGRRPLWLLPQPQPLEAPAGLPRWHGPLRLGREPERIESGWWDGRDVARDYYVATDVRGARLWIFREHAAPRGWYLHGLFG